MVKNLLIISLFHISMLHSMALRRAARPLSKKLIWQSRQTRALIPLAGEAGYTDLNAQLCDILSEPHINFTQAIELVNHGAHPSMQSVRGINIVQHLVGRADYNKKTIKIIEAYPALVDVPCFTGSTPLHNAVRTLNVEMVQTLIASGADVNKQNIYGYTPLHTLADYHAQSSTTLILVLSLLIKHDANALLCTYDKQTAAEIAQERGNTALYNMLKSIEVMFYSTKSI